MSDPGALLVRCDASVAIGTGHAMRCLALAQAWQDVGGHVVFTMVETTSAVEGRLQREGIGVARVCAAVGSEEDAQATIALARANQASWIVMDGYCFDARYQAELKEAKLKVLLVDDNGHQAHYSADIVLNQNVYAREDPYQSRESYTKLLLGPRFAMLRREFAAWRGWKREIPIVARNVLVTMGGSDPDNVSARVVQAILSEHDFEVTVIVGGSNPHLPNLRDLIADHKATLRLVENPDNMPELIARADIAVAAAGTTSLEMCFLGLPILLVALADNQRPVAEELSRRGVAVHLGDSPTTEGRVIARRLIELATSAVTRRSMSELARQQVDGCGVKRVLRALQTSDIRMRRAESSDCRPLWNLVNDPTVRASAFSPESIPWDDHVAWFRKKMEATTCQFLIGETAGTMVGQVRVDQCSEREGEISLSVVSGFRGTGAGHRMLELAVRQIFATTALLRIHAYIQPQNLVSIRAFEKAGFLKSGEAMVRGSRAAHYIRERNSSPDIGEL